MAANAGRYPVSAQCGILGVPRSTCCAMRPRADAPKAPDPVEPDAPAAHGASRGRYGSRKTKAAPARSGKTVGRRRICRIMGESGLSSAYGRKRFEAHPGKPNEADAPDIAARGFRGRAPRTHVRSDLAYARVGGGWSCVCPPIGLHSRETAGRSAGPRKDAGLAGSAFATPDFPISGIEVSHTGRGGEFDNAKIGCPPDAFDARRSLSKKGRPCDNAVDESANKMPKAEFAYRESFADARESQVELSDCVHWCNNLRIHSALGYMSPVEFRKAGLAL